MHFSVTLVKGLLASLLLLSPMLLFASTSAESGGTSVDYSGTVYGILSLAVFVVAYSTVIAEEALHLRKSKAVMVAAGIIWALVAVAYSASGRADETAGLLRHQILEYAELGLFLLAAMTYIVTLTERNVFDYLRAKMVSAGFSLRTVFWLTGVLAFVLSPIADNLTTALIVGAIVMAIGQGNVPFISISCVNIVVAANAGGAFSPFGDITTLMVWQKGIIEFQGFFVLIIPSLVNWLIPAAILSFFLSEGKPQPVTEEVVIKRGGLTVVGLFLLTIVMAVCSHNFLHLPPVIGMMTGLGILNLYSYYLKKSGGGGLVEGHPGPVGHAQEQIEPEERHGNVDFFENIEKAEWDTLMFFYGVILCVGGLGALGYLSLVSEMFYGTMGPTVANILVGIASALVDNIPVMFAVLSMMPEMPESQWLLVTLTAGVGGSLLSIGSAAGVALMGQARGYYTFFSHLKWTWAVALGYAASIWMHLWLNG